LAVVDFSSEVHHVAMIVMVVTGCLLVIGITLTLWWARTGYEAWEPEDGGDAGATGEVSATRPLPMRVVAFGYLRGVAIALVGGFWAGALVTGPAIRLIMRLLAVTAGDAAQGRITEADEVVGKINLDGTLALFVFGGVLPAMLSGAIYVLVRRWLPAGLLAGVTFGALHLVFAATRIDPLRPGNPDFDLVGPTWVAAVTFALAALLHGMAVVAIANRYSHALPPHVTSRARWVRAALPLILPALLVALFFFALVPIAVGLAIALIGSQIGVVVRAVRSRAALVAGRVAITLVVVLVLPGTVTDLRDVIVRRDDAASSTRERPAPPHLQTNDVSTASHHSPVSPSSNWARTTNQSSPSKARHYRSSPPGALNRPGVPVCS
jgi:hypothetical protein